MTEEIRVEKSDRNEGTKKRFPRFLLALLIFGAVGFLSLIVARMFVFSFFRVPSGGMWPSIPVGSHIITLKYKTAPERGATMVFAYPEDRRQDFVKRVVAIGGDEITVKNGRIAINGWTVPTCEIGPATYQEEDSGPAHKGTLEVEFLGASTYLTFHEQEDRSIANGTWKVQPGQFFVMGDNRDNSHDSRLWNNGQGAGVPLDLAKGTVREPEIPDLPASAAQLKPALDACLQKRPSVTSPP